MTISYAPGVIPEFTLADRLRKARELTGMDQTEFADHAGLSRAGVSNAERGQSTPRRSTLKLWALSTGVPVHWIETGHEETPSPDGDGVPCVECARRDSNPQPSDSELEADDQGGQVIPMSSRSAPAPLPFVA